MKYLFLLCMAAVALLSGCATSSQKAAEAPQASDEQAGQSTPAEGNDAQAGAAPAAKSPADSLPLLTGAAAQKEVQRIIVACAIC